MKIVGIRNISYTSKNGYEVSGVELQCTYKNSRVEGEAVEKVYISKKAIEENEELKVGEEVNFTYNKFGKVERIIHESN